MKIDESTERRIKEAADIVAVASDFIQLKKQGQDYHALCPFHADRHLGSFVISPRKNMCSCFACGARYDAIGFLMNYGQGMTYTESLRWLASKFGIAIPGEAPLKLVPAKPYTPLPPLPTLTMPWEWVLSKQWHKVQVENPLVTWLHSLPWQDEEQRLDLDYYLEIYGVGTSTAPDTNGWTIWWQIDDEQKVRTGKLMKYRPDGHRVHEGYNVNFIHSIARRAGMWSDKDYEARTCLFGLHLVDKFPDAEIAIVESEKTAIIAQTFSTEHAKLFMATGAKSNLTADRLKPLMDRRRWIVAYPDTDGLDEWKQRVAELRKTYDRISLSTQVAQLHDYELDGPKADIADILVRMLLNRQHTTPVGELTRLKTDNPAVATLVNKLNLQPTNQHIRIQS